MVSGDLGGYRVVSGDSRAWSCVRGRGHRVVYGDLGGHRVVSGTHG